MEEHLSHNLTDALRLSADAYYNVGGETSIEGTSQGKHRSAPAWDYASGAVQTLFSTMNSWLARATGEPDAQAVRFMIRQ